MADAHQRRFDVVLVWKLDRYGRSLRHLVNALAELEALGVAFASLRDNLDLSTRFQAPKQLCAMTFDQPGSLPGCGLTDCVRADA